jgi:hypothetical protein
LTKTAAWRSRDTEHPAQIDLLIERHDKVINLCEMKFASYEGPNRFFRQYELRPSSLLIGVNIKY